MLRIQHTFWLLLYLFTCGCAAGTGILAPAPAERNDTLAVWDLEDLSLSQPPRPEVGVFLSAKILETVKQAGYTVVERQKLVLALKELNLGSTALADSATRLRIGRIMGARLMIFGAYQILAGHLRVDLRMVDVETGRILKTAGESVESENLTDWLTAAEKAVQKLI